MDAPLDLCVTDLDVSVVVPEEQGLVEGKPFTMDSGAAENEADPADVPEATLEPSPASVAGRGYLGAGRERIANLGQLKARRRMAHGADVGLLFQAAKVRKPLVAVSATVDKGNMVIFDNEAHDGGCVIPSSAPELQMIRQLVQQVTDRIRLERRNGVYVLRNWLPEGPFVGPGK